MCYLVPAYTLPIQSTSTACEWEMYEMPSACVPSLDALMTETRADAVRSGEVRKGIDRDGKRAG